MGRNVDPQRVKQVLQVISENDGQLRAADVAKRLELPKSSVTRLLPAIDEGEQKWLIEDDRGFLGIFKY